MKTLKQIFAPPVFEDDEKTRNAALINIILLSTALFSIIAFFTILLGGQGTLIASVMTILIGVSSLLLLIPLKKGNTKEVGIALVVSLTLLLSMTLYSGGTVRVPALSLLILTSIIAGLVVGQKTAYISAAANIVIVGILIWAELNELLPPPDNQTSIQQLIIFAISAIMVIILVDQALNAVQQALELAKKNQAQAEKFNIELIQASQDLQLAAEVGHKVSLIKEQSDMLKEATETIRERFDMYYTQIYLTDRNEHNLILKAGTGLVGEQLLNRGHSLPIDMGSINGSAAIQRKAILVEDTAKSLIHRPNALLPQTRSELAIPLIVGERVVGVLDLQSAEAGALKESTLPAFEILASQLAIAIVNAELLSEVEEARQEVEAQSRRFTYTGWENFLDGINRKERIVQSYESQIAATTKQEGGEAPGPLTVPITLSGASIGTLQFEGKQVWDTNDTAIVSAVANQVAQQVENLRLIEQAKQYQEEAQKAVRRLTREGWEEYKKQHRQTTEFGFVYTDAEVKPAPNISNEKSISFPISVREEEIGSVNILNKEDLPEEDAELITSIGEQLSAHLENLRLSEETERRVAELAVINQIGDTLTAEKDLDNLIRKIGQYLPQAFDGTSAYIAMYDERQRQVQVIYMIDKEQEFTYLTPYPIGSGINSHIIESRQPLLLTKDTDRRLRELGAVPISLDNKNQEDTVDENFELTKSYMGVPMIIGNQVLGVISVQSSVYEEHFSESDLRLLTTIAANTAIAIQNARSFEEAQLRAQREHALSKITAAVRASTDPAVIMRTAVREIGATLGRKAEIRVLSEQTGEK